jgi:hypothetical protein
LKLAKAAASVTGKQSPRFIPQRDKLVQFDFKLVEVDFDIHP